MKFFKKVSNFINSKEIALCTFLMATCPSFASFAFNGVNATTGGSRDMINSGASARVWPWHKFLNMILEELTGPLPMMLGVLGIVGAAIALFSGHGGDGAKKFIVLVFAVSIALAAPTLMQWLSADTNGFLIR